jgi:hypothetical protein
LTPRTQHAGAGASTSISALIEVVMPTRSASNIIASSRMMTTALVPSRLTRPHAADDHKQRQQGRSS